MNHPLFDRLDRLTAEYADQHSCLRADEIQAFLLALLSGPDPLEETPWQDILLHEFPGSEEQRSELIAAAGELIAEIRRHLAEKELPAQWLYTDENGNGDYYAWCNAYLYGVEQAPSDWFERADDEDFEDLFFPLMALAGEYDGSETEEALLTFSEREIRQLEDSLADAVTDIARYWQAVLNKPKPVRREGGKTGRNDPCPCQSGKKYKACCGKAV